jgi:hypothetical protein
VKECPGSLSKNSRNKASIGDLSETVSRIKNPLRMKVENLKAMYIQ